jgi:hypothetical protein
MRPARERIDGQSPTPIYDALYAEYRRAFKALPGDRSGEEDLGFKSFAEPTEFTGSTGFTTGHYGTHDGSRGRHGPGRHAAKQLTSGAPGNPNEYERGGWGHGPEELLPAVLPHPQRHEP